METIVWGNYKGGVGKTTSVFQVAAQFAANGKRVLLVDLDPQCSLSNICCNSNNDSLSNYSAEQTFNYLLELYMRYIMGQPQFDYELLKGDMQPVLEDILDWSLVGLKRREFKDNLFFIPSSLSFENCRINELAQRMDRNIFNVFAIQLFINDLDKIEQKFDYVFFDCPPTTNLLIQGTFLSSDYYIVPTIIDMVSSQGVADYITEIEKTWNRFNMDKDIGSIMIHKVFHEKSKLIGVFETIYKERRGNADNSPEIAQLDRNISSIPNMKSILCDKKYEKFRYSKDANNFTTENIFNIYIGHRDNRSGGESIPLNTGRGQPTPSYAVLAKYILEILG